MDHLRQSKKKIVDKERREGASNHKTWIDKEESDVVCVVGLEGNRSLWAVIQIKQLILNTTLTTAEITTSNWEEDQN